VAVDINIDWSTAFASKPAPTGSVILALLKGRHKAPVECCSLLFIVNGSIVQLFKRDCSFLFSNESRLAAVSKFFKADQRLAFSGMKLALCLGSLDSK
jgi:hypothetical protein